MRLTTLPSNGLTGTASIPGDKSISHRAALLSSVAVGTSHITNFLDAGVTRAMLNVLRELGIEWELHGTELSVQGVGLKGLNSPNTLLNCGNSATTMRLLAGMLGASGLSATLDGTAGLRKRPMTRLVDPLRKIGVPITASSTGTAPLSIQERLPTSKLRGTTILLQAASAQVKSAILLATLDAEGPVSVIEPAASRDHTERMLSSMGVKIERLPELGRVTLYPDASRSLQPLNLAIPGDFSSAAFFIVAALVTPGSNLVIQNVGLNPGRTGLLDVLIEMGAEIEVGAQGTSSLEPFGTLRVQYSELVAIEVSGDRVVRMIDEFPIFAVAAAFARGATLVRDAGELRHKETDRISELCSLLTAVGVDITQHTDGFEIHGRRRPTGGTVDGSGDHRLAMALATLGLASENGITVDNAEIMTESFPQFGEQLREVGARIGEDSHARS